MHVQFHSSLWSFRDFDAKFIFLPIECRDTVRVDQAAKAIVRLKVGWYPIPVIVIKEFVVESIAYAHPRLIHLEGLEREKLAGCINIRPLYLQVEVGVTCDRISTFLVRKDGVGSPKAGVRVRVEEIIQTVQLCVVCAKVLRCRRRGYRGDMLWSGRRCGWMGYGKGGM